jgi:hypothetical protein
MLGKYRATACHVAYAASSFTTALEDIQNHSTDSPGFQAAVVTLRQSNHTHIALEEAARVLVSHSRHAKDGGATSNSYSVFAELAYERFRKPQPEVVQSEVPAGTTRIGFLSNGYCDIFLCQCHEGSSNGKGDCNMERGCTWIEKGPSIINARVFSPATPLSSGTIGVAYGLTSCMHNSSITC